MASKDILFYSNYCEFSNEILNIIIRKNVTTDFMLVCVDNNKYSLPAFVDRVPIVYAKSEQVLTDSDIVSYINERYPSVNEDIMPFSLGAQAYTNGYAFIEDAPVVDQENMKYSVIGQDNTISIRPEMMSSQSTDETSKKSKFDSSMLDKFMQSRDSDLKNFKNNMNGGGNYSRPL